MLELQLTCDPLSYRTHAEMAPNGYHSIIRYNEELLDTLYGERLYHTHPKAVYARRDPRHPTEITLSVLAWLEQVPWPGWNASVWHFNATTGQEVGRAFKGISIFNYWISVSRNGEMFTRDHWSSIRAIDPETFQYTGEAFSPSYWRFPDEQNGRFTSIVAYWVLVDRPANLAMVITNRDGLTSVSKHRLSTGMWLQRYTVADRPKEIHAEDEGRCFVISDRGVITLLDYQHNQILGVLKHRLPVGVQRIYGWDQFYRRLLVFERRPDDPATGACQSRIECYRLQTVSTGLQAPLPLQAPRAGRTVPILTRVYGEMGEGLAGQPLTVTDQGAATVRPSQVTTVHGGWARGSAVCNAAGEAVVTVTLGGAAVVVPDPEGELDLTPAPGTVPPPGLTLTTQTMAWPFAVQVVSFDTDEGVALQFTTPAEPAVEAREGTIIFEQYVDFETNFKLMTLSPYAGDFRTDVLPAVHWATGPAGSIDFYIEVDPEATTRTDRLRLEPNTTYYLNLRNASAVTPTVDTCPLGAACGVQLAMTFYGDTPL